jgi:hypothetical protein
MAAVTMLPCQICALNDYEQRCFNFAKDETPEAITGMCQCGHMKFQHAIPVPQPAPAAVPQGMTQIIDRLLTFRRIESISSRE